jgi:hypothetical protein
MKWLRITAFSLFLLCYGMGFNAWATKPITHRTTVSFEQFTNQLFWQNFLIGRLNWGKVLISKQYAAGHIVMALWVISGINIFMIFYSLLEKKTPRIVNSRPNRITQASHSSELNEALLRLQQEDPGYY